MSTYSFQDIQDILKLIFSETDSGEITSQELKKLIQEYQSLLTNQYVRQKSFEKIDLLNNVLLSYAMHNYSAQVEEYFDNDWIDSLVTSINLLGEELNHSTVTKHYLQDIFNSIADMLIVIDDSGYISSINNETSEKLLYDLEEILRKNIRIILDDDISLEEIIDAQDKNKNTQFITKSNEVIPVQLNVSPFVRGDNEKIGYVIIARDITDSLNYQREIEEQNAKIRNTNDELRVALKKAEEADHLKTAFLQNMSHEIRTPLNVIVGFSNLLNDFNITSEERAEYTAIISKSGNRLIELVNNILEISKIETGQVKVVKKYFMLNELMDEICKSFTKEIAEKRLEFICNKSEVELEILADSGKLRQILINLIKNAIKFTEEGKIEYGYILKDDFIEFFVADTGIGIPEDFQEKLFERFTQIDNSMSKDYEGAGLGLSICRGLTGILGGKIWFKSKENEGSTFRFTIPFIPKHDYKHKTENQEQNQPKKELNILVAEDDNLNYIFFERLLRYLGHKATRAHNGQDAVELCASHDFDLVFMDIKMPIMNGLEATKIIKVQKPELPIFALTAFAFNEEKETLHKNGFDAVLSKPIEMYDVVKALKTLK
jgi:PAS domain S-box-containing protein